MRAQPYMQAGWYLQSIAINMRFLFHVLPVTPGLQSVDYHNSIPDQCLNCQFAS